MLAPRGHPPVHGVLTFLARLALGTQSSDPDAIYAQETS